MVASGARVGAFWQAADTACPCQDVRRCSTARAAIALGPVEPGDALVRAAGIGTPPFIAAVVATRLPLAGGRSITPWVGMADRRVAARFGTRILAQRIKTRALGPGIARLVRAAKIGAGCV